MTSVSQKFTVTWNLRNVTALGNKVFRDEIKTRS